MTYVPKNTEFISSEEGFTILELLVVLSILMFITIPAIVGYVSYANSQNVNNAALDIKNMLITAQSRALSIVNAPDSGPCKNKPLQSYDVHLCNTVTGCTAYALYAACNN